MEFLVRPAGHETLDEMQGVLVVVAAELGDVRRVQIQNVRAESPDRFRRVQVERLALFAVVEHQPVELAHRASERLDELGQRRVGELGLLQAGIRVEIGFAVHLGPRELTEGTLGLDGGAERRQRQVFLVAVKLLNVRPDLVQPPEHRFGVVVPVEVIHDERACVRVGGKDSVHILVAQSLAGVFHHGPRQMVGIAQEVVGDDLQSFALEVVGDVGPARKGVEDAFRVLRDMAFDPAEHQVLAAHETGDADRFRFPGLAAQ